MIRKVTYLLAVIFCNSSLFAGNDNYPLSAQSAAMGNAAVALSGSWSIFHNQAGLAGIQHISAGIGYESRFLVPELGVKGGMFILPVNSHVLGLSLSSFGYSKYNETKYGLAYARKFSEIFSIGFQLNYNRIFIAENYGSKGVLSAEAGILAKLTDELTLGAHVFNPHQAKIAEYDDERSPAIMRLGLNYRFSKKVLVVVEFEKDIDHPAVIKAGIEYHPMPKIYFRAGAASNPFLTSFGLGILLEQFKLDIAASYHTILGYTPQINISYTAQ